MSVPDGDHMITDDAIEWGLAASMLFNAVEINLSLTSDRAAPWAQKHSAPRTSEPRTFDRGRCRRLLDLSACRCCRVRSDVDMIEL